jgi:hypothetical protein
VNQADVGDRRIGVERARGVGRGGRYIVGGLETDVCGPSSR